jgi:hypothetical protein
LPASVVVRIVTFAEKMQTDEMRNLVAIEIFYQNKKYPALGLDVTQIDAVEQDFQRFSDRV